MKEKVISVGLLIVVIIFLVCSKDEPTEPIIVMPPSGKIESGNFMHDDHVRFYKVFMPKDYYDKEKFPLVIFLHMGGSTAQQEMDYTGFNKVANNSGFMVAWPDAVINYWNSGVSDIPDKTAPDVDDVGFINALIDTLNKKFKVDLNRIYIGGFGNGNRMAHKLGCQLNNRITAIGGATGSPCYSTFNDFSLSRAIPVIYIHGTSDTECPILGDSAQLPVDSTLRFWTSANSCMQVDSTLLPDLDPTDNCRVEKISYTNCSNNVSVIYLKVINGGCNWPSAPGNYSWEGNKTKDVDANVEILNFFQQYELGKR